jgi:hypothetical protein
MTPQKRVVLITGASAGIGQAFAEVFAEHGWDLVVTARRRDRLDALARTLGERHGTRVHVVTADLADRNAGERIAADVVKAGLAIDGLVNNAGYAVPAKYRSSTWQQQADFIQVMVTAVAELTHRFLPGMVERKFGRVINIASVLGLLPGVSTGHTLYGPAKAFVVRFSQALSTEVHKHGVHVTAVCPGFTYSEFHDVSNTRDEVKGYPRPMWMDAETVARQGYDASMRGDVVYVNGWINWGITSVAKVIPEELLMKMVR